MYNKVLNYFERTYCIENIYFRKHWKLWMFGWLIVFSLCVIIEKTFEVLGHQYSTTRTVAINAFLVIPFLIVNMVKMYQTLKEAYGIKGKGKIDFLTIITKEATDSFVTNVQIEGMKKYLTELGIYSRQTIEDIIGIAQKEVSEKYPKRDLIEQFFSKIIPLLLVVLTIFLTNNNVKDLNSIVSITIVGIVSALCMYYFFYGIRNINISPVNKRNNLLDFIEVMENLKIETK